jgi:membrane protein required for colicin V production
MVDARFAVGAGGAFKEYEFRRSLTEFHAFFEGMLLSPSLKNPFSGLHQVKSFIFFETHNFFSNFVLAIEFAKIRNSAFFIKQMGILDIILLICFIPALVHGIRKGLIEQIVSIVSIFAGAWLAFKFTAPLSTWLTQFINLESKILHVICFALVVVLVVLVLFLIGRILTRTLKLVSLGWINSLLGILFALLKTALVIGLIIFVFDSLNSKWVIINPEILKESVVYTALRDASLKVFPYLKSLLTNAQ